MKKLEVVDLTSRPLRECGADSREVEEPLLPCLQIWESPFGDLLVQPSLGQAKAAGEDIE